MSGHFLNRCVCGRVLSQCRCPGPKRETTVSPCRCECEPDSPTMSGTENDILQLARDALRGEGCRTSIQEALELCIAELERLLELIEGRYHQGGRSEIDYQNEIERITDVHTRMIRVEEGHVKSLECELEKEEGKNRALREKLPQAFRDGWLSCLQRFNPTAVNLDGPSESVVQSYVNTLREIEDTEQGEKLRIVTDPSVPAGEMQVRHPDGRVDHVKLTPPPRRRSRT